MASGSFTVSTSNSNIDGKVTWSSTENVAANTSTVSCEMRLWRSNTGYTTYGTGDFYIIIDGTRYDANNKSFTLTYNSNTLIMTASRVVTHDSDGKKSITISWGGSTNVFSVNSGSGTATLDTIPRKSTLTSGWTWTAGDNPVYNISRADSSFTHDIEISVNSGSGLVVLHTQTGVGTSFTWVPSSGDMQTIFDYCNNDTVNFNQGTSIKLTTKSGGTIIGTNTYTGAVNSPTQSTTGSSLSFNIGSSVAVSISRAKSYMVHTLRFYVNGTLIHTSPTGQTTSYTWNPSASEITAMYNATSTVKSAESKVEIDTFWDGYATPQKIKTTWTKTGTATVTNSTPTFSTITYLDTSTKTTLTGNNQYIIQNYSSLRAQVLNANKAVAKNSATITKYIATVAGKSLTVNSPFATDITFDFGAINNGSNQTLTITAYDSRGYEVSVTKTVLMVAYAPPVVTTSATRQDGFLDSTTIKLSGSISPLNVAGVNKNSLVSPSMTWKTRIKGGAYGAATVWLGQTLTMPNYTTTNVVTNLANTSAWDIEINVTDQITNTVVTLNVGTGQPILFLDDSKKSAGFGKLPVAANTLELTWDVDTTGKVTARNGLFTAGKDVDTANGAFVANNGGASNIDHMWHDDTNNAWNFVSDATYKAAGNSKLVAGHLDVSTGNVTANNINIKSLVDASNTSTTHGLTIGEDTTGARLKMDTNEIQTYNGTGTADIHINPEGGTLKVNQSVGYTGLITDGMDVWNQVRIYANGGNTLELHGTDHSYIEFMAKGHNGTRTGYIGYPSSSSTYMTVYSLDAIRIIPANGAGSGSGFVFDAVSNGGIDFGVSKCKFLATTATIQARNSADIACAPMNASAFTVNSDRNDKKNITIYEDDALAEILSTPIYQYHYNNELDTEMKHTGVILQESPTEIVDPLGTGVDVYPMTTMSWRAIQQVYEKFDTRMNAMQEEINQLKGA